MKEELYVPILSTSGLTIDALVEFWAHVSAIAQIELDRIKQRAPASILKIDDRPNFQIWVSNTQLEKPLATATRNFGIRDCACAEHYVLLKNSTGSIIVLYFMRQNS